MISALSFPGAIRSDVAGTHSARPVGCLLALVGGTPDPWYNTPVRKRAARCGRGNPPLMLPVGR